MDGSEDGLNLKTDGSEDGLNLKTDGSEDYLIHCLKEG